MPGDADKHAWRIEIKARRLAITPEEHAAEAMGLVAAMRALHPRGWVCAYVPVGDEPGSTAMLDALRAAHARVLLPITGAPGPLLWSEYEGRNSLRRAKFGLLEPTGATLPASAVGWAELILVPALAVDRRGVRLGRGAGYYDRTLAAARPDARLVAVVRDDEVVDELPEEPHDLRMGWALTPRGGLLRLGDGDQGDTTAAE
ncbi:MULTISPECIES: 5-formyltetrahydrofolate cyclo-ligase [unclassified Nocardia]|uniref:5-formyltetrahydrofolate cyclo-ligase n=1 Tax=unclassified Nocardia TaxID=2637762 RepID=UPI001CE3DEA6|nr:MULTISPECIES: 5-formyltetrahydrofolate cyclo-ligase [unclassified Nocardia]